MNDYTYPSVFFAYAFFVLMMLLAVYYCIRSWKDGYWGPKGEDIKYQIFDDNGTDERSGL
jgi:hypothetical protein